MKNAGDKQQTICYNCNDVTQSTFSHRDVKLSGADVVASCGVCGWITALPQQSANDVKAAMNEIERG